MLALLQTLRYGLFCLLMGALLMDFGILCFAGIAVCLWLKPEAIGGMGMLGMIGILGAALFGCVGMLMSFAVPDKSSRYKIGLAVLMQIIGFVCAPFLPGIVSRIFFFLGWLFYTAFLQSLAESIESQKADDLIWLIRAIAGVNSTIVFAIMFAMPIVGLLIFAGIWIADASLYAFLLYVLQGDLGNYIEGVKSGRIDPEAKSKRASMFARTPGPTKGPPPEEPTGPPPEGVNVCKVPKTLPPLHAAVKEGERNKVMIELNKGADVHETTAKNGLTALHVAAVYGVSDIVDCLLKAGARLDQEAERGLTPLMLAVQTGNPNIVGFLISKGANLHHQNEDGLTPLHWACCAPHERMTGLARIKMVNLLADKGAPFDVKDAQGRTPLDLAELNNLKLLVDAINRRFGLVPIPEHDPHDDGAISVTSVEDAEPEGFQLEGADLCQMPTGNLPPLHDVVKLGDSDKVEAALAGGRNLQEKVGRGLTPLHLAAIVGVMASADLLLRKGAQTEDTCEGGLTPLYFAIQTNNTNLVGLLLSRGANVNHKNDQGRTPLHWAAAVPSKKLEGQARVRMVQMLLQKKADPKITDSRNKTPGWLAQEAGFPEVAQAIERHMAPVQKVDDDDD